MQRAQVFVFSSTVLKMGVQSRSGHRSEAKRLPPTDLRRFFYVQFSFKRDEIRLIIVGNDNDRLS